MSRIIDMTGKKIGQLTVLERAENTSSGQAQWRCQCSCGNVFIAIGQYLRNGKVKSCGCYSRQIGKQNFKDITGQQFGKLTVLNFKYFDNNSHSVWECQCSCGKTILVAKPNLISGSVASCGCLKTSNGEYIIEHFLIEHKIQFEREFTFEDLRSDKNYPLRFDFYLPDYNLLIEYDGIQHFKDINFLNSKLIQAHDKIKNDYCQQNNLSLLRIPYTEFANIENLLKENLKIG